MCMCVCVYTGLDEYIKQHALGTAHVARAYQLRHVILAGMLTHADVCCRRLTYADVC